MKQLSRPLPSLPAPQGQRGVVLIIALVMLLILTLIGVAGLRDTQLQERMAGGAQDREVALQAAETALREAENKIDAGTADDDDVAGNYKDYQTADAADVDDLQRGGVTEAVYWRDVYVWTNDDDVYISSASLGGSLSAQPRYVIERLPNNYSEVPGSWNATGSTTPGTPIITDYIITARATGVSADTVVILQSHYRDVDTY